MKWYLSKKNMFLFYFLLLQKENIFLQMNKILRNYSYVKSKLLDKNMNNLKNIYLKIIGAKE